MQFAEFGLILFCMFVNDEKTFDRVIREYYPRVVGYISLIHSALDAQDIAQDIFVTLWEKRSDIDFNDERHLTAWLLRVAKTRSIDCLRRKSFGQQRLGDILNGDLEWLEDCDEELFEKLGRKDLYDRILYMADELPRDRREVFRLSYVSMLPAKDISQITGFPLRTVENHLYQALKFLRGKIKSL